MAGRRETPIMLNMNSPKPYRRYALVDRRETGAGIRRLKLARVTGMLPVASTAPAPPAKSAMAR
jgi:hypothetical protein